MNTSDKEGTIFNQDVLDSVDNSQSDELQTTSQESSLPDEVMELIGEGKKYANQTEALKALFHSQKHISKIEQENAEMRERLNKSKTVEELLEKKEENAKQGMVNLDDVEKLVEQKVSQKLSESEKKDLMKSNLRAVDKAMKEKFGEKAQEIMINRAKELNMNVDDITYDAATRPDMFLALFDVMPKQKDAGAILSNSGNVATNVQQESVKPFSYKYYEKIRKENPSVYMSSKVQGEMHKKMLELGTSFWE